MKLICPHCQKSATVPDDRAGERLNCEHCGEQYMAPTLYPTFDPVPPEPPPEPPPEHAVPPADVKALPGPGPGPGSRSRPAASGAKPAKPASPPAEAVLAYLPITFLLAGLALTFFNWVEAAPYAGAGYSQTGWQEAFGGLSRGAAVDRLIDRYDRLDEATGWDPCVLLYLPCAAAAVALAAATLAAERGKALPDWLGRVWPYRDAALVGLTGACLVLLLLQAALGRELTDAVRAVAADDLAAGVGVPFLKRPTESSVAALPAVDREILHEAMVATYAVTVTSWARLAILANALALLAAAAETRFRPADGAARRLPRVRVEW